MKTSADADVNSQHLDAPAKEGRRSDFIRALSRGLSVIVAMSNRPDGMTLSQVAEAARLDRAATRRALLTLEELKYVIADERRFSLSPRVLDLGYAYLSSMPLWEVAGPYIRNIAEETQESCSIGVYDEGDVVYVARAQSSKRLMFMNVNIGTRMSAASTSMGRVLLAGLPPKELEAYLRTVKIRKSTDRTVTDKDQLRSLVEQVRRQGWAYVDQEMEVGVRSIAVPLHNRNDVISAAMNVSVQAARVSVAEIKRDFLPLLQRSAKEIDRALRARLSVA